MLRDIVDRGRHGDEEAFGALVSEVGDRCIFIAHRILRDANLAEDAVQVALVQVWRELPALRDLDRFEAWLHRILVHACYDQDGNLPTPPESDGDCWLMVGPGPGASGDHGPTSEWPIPGKLVVQDGGDNPDGDKGTTAVWQGP